jgi:hypothetical protein
MGLYNKTPKEELVAQELAKGLTEAEAYGRVYSCTKASALSNAPTYLANNPHIRQRAIDIKQTEAGLT